MPERFPGEAWVGQVEWIAADAAEEGQLDEVFAGGVDGVVGCLGSPPNEHVPHRLSLTAPIHSTRCCAQATRSLTRVTVLVRRAVAAADAEGLVERQGVE